jgi:hypothetical protein
VSERKGGESEGVGKIRVGRGLEEVERRRPSFLLNAAHAEIA